MSDYPGRPFTRTRARLRARLDELLDKLLDDGTGTVRPELHRSRRHVSLGLATLPSAVPIPAATPISDRRHNLCGVRVDSVTQHGSAGG